MLNLISVQVTQQDLMQGGAVRTWLLGPDTGLVAVEEMQGSELQAHLYDAAPQDMLRLPASLQQAEVSFPGLPVYVGM